MTKGKSVLTPCEIRKVRIAMLEMVFDTSSSGVDLTVDLCKAEWRGTFPADDGYWLTSLMSEMMVKGYVTPKAWLDGGVPDGGGGWDGITWAGVEHLHELKHPVRVWMFRNWFPLSVAIVTFLVSLVGFVVPLVVAS